MWQMRKCRFPRVHLKHFVLRSLVVFALFFVLILLRSHHKIEGYEKLEPPLEQHLQRVGGYAKREPVRESNLQHVGGYVIREPPGDEDLQRIVKNDEHKSSVPHTHHVETMKNVGDHNRHVATPSARGGSLSKLAEHGHQEIWYSEGFDQSDRILAQLMYQRKIKGSREIKLFKIYVPQHFVNGKQIGRQYFFDDNCSMNNCLLTTDYAQRYESDVVIYQGPIPEKQNPKQITVWYALESPFHTPSLKRGTWNWTATYRHDSTLVAPYEKYVPIDNNILTKPQSRNYARNKTKLVAWFVSNCHAMNNRLKYANELQQYISVDIYGACGTLQCPRGKDTGCFEKLSKEYKFYLAFENSNCRDYITEKYFINGLSNDIVPIAMGAHPDDYKRSSPPHSFIHVDNFDSPKHLAEYLHYLDKNDAAYNKFFEWKGVWTYINTKFLCRVCSMVNAAHYEKHTQTIDAESWWRGPGTCINGKWPKSNRTSD